MKAEPAELTRAEIKALPPNDRHKAREASRLARIARLSESAEHKLGALRAVLTKDQKTDRQNAWDVEKAATLRERVMSRGVPVTVANRRRPYLCDCPHRRKKHKQTGRCRGNCLCAAAASRARAA